MEIFAFFSGAGTIWHGHDGEKNPQRNWAETFQVTRGAHGRNTLNKNLGLGGYCGNIPPDWGRCARKMVRSALRAGMRGTMRSAKYPPFDP